jgi:hypothetical protein
MARKTPSRRIRAWKSAETREGTGNILHVPWQKANSTRRREVILPTPVGPVGLVRDLIVGNDADRRIARPLVSKCSIGGNFRAHAMEAETKGGVRT